MALIRPLGWELPYAMGETNKKKKRPGSSFAAGCGVGRRCSSDLVLLWLWYKLAAAAPIQPLAWELPCAAGAALKRQKQNPISGEN